MLTYLDSGVLIAAAKGNEQWSQRAFQIIDDSSRTFVASPFLRLETSRMSSYHGFAEQVAMYDDFLLMADIRFEDAGAAVTKAEEIAAKYGVEGLDAMHVASALLVHAVEIITTEKLTKPMYRVGSLITVRHISQV